MDPLQRAQALLQECNQIIAQLEAWRACHPSPENIDGLQSMTSTLLSERRFLKKIASTPADEIRVVQVNSSNVPYFKALVHALVHSRNPVAVRKTFSYTLDPYTSIMPTESFRSINPTANSPRHKEAQAGSNTKQPTVMPLRSSQPLSTQLPNHCKFEVKVDVVADHGKSWLRINAGSAWSILHEFAEMEDDSDDEQEEESDNEEDEEDEGEVKVTPKTKKPEIVSKETHPDMTLLVRSLVLAADQNRVHYYHRPQLTLRFAGFSPLDGEESEAVVERIQKAIRIGQFSQSVFDGTLHRYPVNVEMGPSSDPDSMTTSTKMDSNENDDETKQAPTAMELGMDPKYHPFSIPVSVDDMELFTETLHLDITTLMALSSVLCHRINIDPALFTSPPLILQAQQEHQQPALPILAKVFEGRKRLVISRAGVTRFRSILEIIGGPEEKWRGKVLIHDPLETNKGEEEENELQIRERWVQGSDWAREYGVFVEGPPRIEVIEDCLGKDEQAVVENPNPETTIESNEKPKELAMSELHARIFMTGYHTRLTTVTANQVGYRAVRKVGLIPPDVSIWFHAPRSLAEAKMSIEPRP